MRPNLVFADSDPEGTAVFDAWLCRLGLWHFGGMGHFWIAPKRRLRDCFDEAENYRDGRRYLIMRIHNRTEDGYGTPWQKVRGGSLPTP